MPFYIKLMSCSRFSWHTQQQLLLKLHSLNEKGDYDLGRCTNKQILPKQGTYFESNSCLSLVSMWSSGSSRSSQSSQKMFRRSGQSYGNATQTIANNPDDWDNLYHLDRIEFYPDDRDNHVNFEAIIWKHSRTAETIGTIKGYPRNHHSYPTTPSSHAPFQNTSLFMEEVQNYPTIFLRTIRISLSEWIYGKQ